MSFETSKATKRRMAEGSFKNGRRTYQWANIFDGIGVDVGCGPDKLPFERCIGFDERDGDANRLSSYLPAEHFDYIHGSHVLEHMHDPDAALRDWLRIVKPGGYVIQTVPDIGAYERFTYPSKFNPDHKAGFSMIYRGSAFPIHCHLPTFLAGLEDVAETILCRYVEANYDWKLPLDIDQTWKVENGTEIWNEFVIRKL